MFEKALHTGNIAAAFAIVATAADLTFAGGAGTVIGAALSGHALVKNADKKLKPHAISTAKDMQKFFDNSHLTDDHKKITAQMLAKFPPSEADFAPNNMDAKTVAATMRQRVKDTANDPAHKTETALNDYAAILTAMLGPLLKPQDQTQAMLQEMLARTEVSGDATRLRDAGITEKAIIGLAQRIAGETNDLTQAWGTLEDAMETALRVQDEGRFGSNHGEFVNQVLARVADLAAEGEYSDAARAIDDALDEEQAAHERRKERLLESGVEMARLVGDAMHAANLLLQQADLAAGGLAEFQALRLLRRGYYEKGRDKGIALDLGIAIRIAELVLERASNPDERGAALNDLGNALQTLGQRESDTARLEQAVTAYENALLELTRERAPMEWATTQNNLGAALQTLGQRESNTARLEQAVTAFENALKERTREHVPLDWAMTQMNLGNALRTHGERESGTARLEQAATAFENALLEYTRERVPLDWASTKGNLANLELAFFDKVGDAGHLDRALTHARAAKVVFIEAQASQYIAMIDRSIARINAKRDDGAQGQ